MSSDSVAKLRADGNDLVSLKAIYADGGYKATDHVSAYFDEIERRKHLNVYVTQTKDLALQQAEAADKRRDAGELKALDGIALAVKDNYCTHGVRTTAGSKILENFVPTYESTVTQKLWDAGATLVGKVNMDEFAMGSSTETSYFGTTQNPVADDLGLEPRVPGGSSGGSAAAVAGKLADAALGSDTGGSVRQPASFCGLVGFKPSYGTCSRWGIIAYGSSLDQAGTMTTSVRDAALLMDVIAGHDAKDSTSVETSFNFSDELSKPVSDLKLGLPIELLESNSTKDSDIVWKRAKELAKSVGAQLVEVSMPNMKYALQAYYIIALSEASSNLARYDGVRYGFRAENPADLDEMYIKTRSAGFGDEVKRRIMLGTFALSAGYYDAYFKKAQRVRAVVAKEFKQAFGSIDALLMPTTPTAAFKAGNQITDPVQMYLEDIYTVPVNMVGLPAISIPVAKSSDGMPLGLQVIGPQFSDTRVLQIASSLEQHAG